MSFEWAAIPKNVLARLLDVERRLDDLEGDAALPVVDPEGEGDTTYPFGEFVRLDGGNQGSWIPNPGDDATQDITGHFNLAGAAYQYKISGRHALSMPGTGNLLAGDGAGAALLATGMRNVLVGYRSGLGLGNADDLVIIGHEAGIVLTTSDASVIIGSYAAGTAVVVDESEVIGYMAAEAVTSGVSQSQIIGSYACAASDWVTGSVVLGYDAAENATNIFDSVIMGWQAARGVTRAEESVIIGMLAGESWLDGYRNVVVGAQAGNDADGDYNVYVGYGAGWVSTGDSNVGIGYGANAGTGDENVVIGDESGNGALFTGSNTVIVGALAGGALTTGHENVLIGYKAGEALTTDSHNVIIGYMASPLTAAEVTDSTIIGYQAAGFTSRSITNAVIIANSSLGLAKVDDSVIIGEMVLANANGTAISYHEVLIGENVALAAAYIGSYNVFIGEDAGRLATTNDDNVAVGHQAGRGITTGSYNAILGSGAGYSLGAGLRNTILGREAARTLAGANDGVYVGYRAGYYETAGSKLFIDNAQRASEADARVKALLYGVFDAATANQYLTVNGHIVGLEKATFTAGLSTLQSVANYSDPPTDAELDAAFGTPATLGRGFMALLDDNDADTDGYIVWTSDASWYYIKATKAA